MDLNTVYIIISVVVSAFAITGSVWAIFKKIFRVSEISFRTEKIPDIENKINNFPCQRHEYDITSFGKDILTLKNYFGDISRWIMKYDNDMIDTFVPKHSPRTINKAGNELLKDTCAQKTVDDNLPLFISEIEKYGPQTAYDVEELSLKILLENTGKDIFNCIKNYIYFKPQEMEYDGKNAKGLRLNPIFMALVITICDFQFKNSSSDN